MEENIIVYLASIAVVATLIVTARFFCKEKPKKVVDSKIKTGETRIWKDAIEKMRRGSLNLEKAKKRKKKNYRPKWR